MNCSAFDHACGPPCRRSERHTRKRREVMYRPSLLCRMADGRLCRGRGYEPAVPGVVPDRTCIGVDREHARELTVPGEVERVVAREGIRGLGRAARLILVQPLLSDLLSWSAA